MPRNSSGTYTLPEAAFVPSTPISSSAVNSDFDDIASALTDSLSRTGDGGMQAALPLNVAGFFYQSDADTGMSRKSANTQVITCGGTEVVEVTTTGVSVLGVPMIPTPIGAVMMWTGSSAPSGWLFPGTYNRAAYPALWAFASTEIGLGNTFYGNGNGATTFTIGTMDGYAPVGVDASSTRLSGVTHIGDTTGSASVTLAANQIPAGVPSSNASQAITVASASIAYDTTTLTTNTGPGSVGQILTNTRTIGPLSSSGNNSISVTSTNAGQQSVSIVQPSRAFKFIIYAGA